MSDFDRDLCTFILIEGCRLHPQYRGKDEPKSECFGCAAVYLARKNLEQKGKPSFQHNQSERYETNQGLASVSQKNDAYVKWGLNIRNYRKTHGLTQAEFGKQTGTPQTQISKYENGQIEGPSADTVLRIKAATNGAVTWPS